MVSVGVTLSPGAVGVIFISMVGDGVVGGSRSVSHSVVGVALGVAPARAIVAVVVAKIAAIPVVGVFKSNSIGSAFSAAVIFIAASVISVPAGGLSTVGARFVSSIGVAARRLPLGAVFLWTVVSEKVIFFAFCG